MKVLLVPSWMGDLHWLIMATALWGLTVWCMMLYRATRDVRPVALGMSWLFAASIATCFWLIQSEILPIDPMILFTIERLCWYPLVVSGLINIDLTAADLNGHRSLIHKLDEFLTKRRVSNEHAKQ